LYRKKRALTHLCLQIISKKNSELSSRANIRKGKDRMELKIGGRDESKENETSRGRGFGVREGRDGRQYGEVGEMGGSRGYIVVPVRSPGLALSSLKVTMFSVKVKNSFRHFHANVTIIKELNLIRIYISKSRQLYVLFLTTAELNFYK
jgi:hypothetical protein